MNVTFLNDEAKEAFTKNKNPLYRYGSLENALITINVRSIWFSDPRQWTDPFEKLFINASYFYNGNKQEFPFKDRLFCMCVTPVENSDATWSAYSTNQTAVRLQINPTSLIELLNNQSEYDVYIGKMDYEKSTKDIRRDAGPIGYDLNDLFDKSVDDKEKLKILLLKRPAYEYEQEFRIILISKSNLPTECGVNIKLPKLKSQLPKSNKAKPFLIKEFIPEITIGPSENKAFKSALTKILKGLVDSKISNSNLKSTLIKESTF